MNNWKRELYFTEMIYLKNGMDEMYEMDQLPSWYTPDKDNLWKHDGSQSPQKQVEKLIPKQTLVWEKTPNKFEICPIEVLSTMDNGGEEERYEMDFDYDPANSSFPNS